MATYSEKLKDARWQQKRLTMFGRAGWQCEQCFSPTNQLHLHHNWYETGRDPWDYPDQCFSVLCDGCHKRWHAYKLELDKMVAGLSWIQLHQSAGLLAGLRCASECVDLSFRANVAHEYVVGVVRGFWPPLSLLGPLIDECLVEAAAQVPFCLSSAVGSVLEKHGDKESVNHRPLYAWLSDVTSGESEV